MYRTPDEFYFNFNGNSGKFYVNHIGKYNVKSNEDKYFQVEVEVLNNKNFLMPELAQNLKHTMDCL